MFSFKDLSKSGAFAALIFATLASALLLIIGFFSNEPVQIYLATAIICFLLPALVGLRIGGDFDPFEPINLLAASIFYSVTLRAIYVVASDSARTDFVMMGENFETIIEYSPIILLGIVSVCMGYALSGSRLQLQKISAIRNFNLDYRRSWLAICAFGFLGLLGTVLFAQQFGIDFSDGLLNQSVKRNIAFVDDTGEVVYGSGLEQVLGRFASYALIFACGLILSGLVKLRPSIAIAVVVLAVLTVAMPFLASSRSKIIFPILSIAVLAYYWDRISLKSALSAVLLITVVLVGMGALRLANQQGEERGSSADFVFGATNGLDLARTSAIMRRVPSKHEYLEGSSYAALITAPIPRSVWIDKPNPSLGAWVKGDLFGVAVKKNGWPPGMIAEAYVNFGLIGVPLVMFLLGGFLRISYETVRPMLGVNFAVTVLWAVSVWKLTWDVFGLNFAQGILQTLQFFLPMIFLLVIARSSAVYRPATG